MIDALRDLLTQTLTNPRYAVQRLLKLFPDAEARWLAAGLVIVLTLMQSQLFMMIAPPDEAAMLTGLMGGPVQNAVLQVATLLVAAWGMSGLARQFGGRAGFEEALIAVAWIEFVLILVSLVQVVVTYALPMLEMPLAVLSVGLFFWLLTEFTATLNGFTSLPKVFVGVLASVILGGMAMLLLIGMTGLSTLPVQS